MESITESLRSYEGVVREYKTVLMQDLLKEWRSSVGVLTDRIPDLGGVMVEWGVSGEEISYL
tara:strand:+ start:3424 stop:3609 length:186 start_codon:yes stop_codon:yes gene_type:complete